MGIVVVRCPGCRGASRVGPEAVGLLVLCPRCSDPFLAVEEAAAVAPAPSRGPARPADRRPRPAATTRPRRSRAEPVAPAGPGAAPHHDPHDPHAEGRGGLPLTVMVGLALVPFAIPLVWLIAPLVAGRPPALSVATPAALAVAFAALCLAVVFTIDWSPATRLKGVVLLLGLAYLSGLSLYFLRKEMVDRVAAVFGPRWTELRLEPKGGPAYQVELPGKPAPENDQPLSAAAVALTCHRAGHGGWAGEFVGVAGVGADPDPAKPDADWFAAAGKALSPRDKGKAVPPTADVPIPGWEWRVGAGRDARTVRVFRTAGAVYYLSAAGPPATGGHAGRMFESFKPAP